MGADHKAEGKLIPVKTPDVAYADIPLPFGEMHTENVGSTDLIRAAVVAQLAKPAMEPSAAALLMKDLKYELLTWFGIIGAVLTLFSAYSAALMLAPLAQKLVEHWKKWTHAFWVWVFGWLGIHLPPEWTPILSFLLFWSSLTIGQMIKFKSTIKNQLIEDQDTIIFRGMMSWRKGVYITFYLIGIIWLAWRFPEWFSFMGQGRTLTGVVVPQLFIIAPSLGAALSAKRNRVHATVAICLMVIFWIIITLSQLVAMKPSADTGGVVSMIALAMVSFLPVFLLSVAPTKAVCRRLIFLAIGLILLIGLNELSNLGLDVTAPWLQG